MKYSLILLLLVSQTAVAKTWFVGPTRQYTVPSAVMTKVADGDTVLVDSGAYVGDVSVWNANNLVLRCPNGMARFNANGNIAQQKGIFVIYGNNAYMEGFELYGAAISEANGDNGAGIRMQGYSFTARRCYIHDNQDGILSGSTADTGTILLEACEFEHNGVETGNDAGYEHNIYIGHCSSLTVKFCYFHRSVMGHEIKTRASLNYILYNYIVDDTDGDGSYSIDIPNGGLACIVGNAIEKGPKTQNSTVVSYGEEGITNGDSEFYFVSNTVVMNRNLTTFLNIPLSVYPTFIANNIFAGACQPVNYYFYPTPNVFSTDTSFFHFRDPVHYDYHPIANFPGFYSAQYFGTASSLPVVLNAEWEYVNPLDSVSRNSGILGPDYEIGAFKAIYPDTLSDTISVIQSLQSSTCAGDTDLELISIANTGNAGRLSDLSLSGPNASDFTIFGGTTHVLAGEIDTFSILFIPTINGIETATLHVYGGTEDSLTLQSTVGTAIVGGSGIAPLTPIDSVSSFNLVICNIGSCSWTPGMPVVHSPFAYVKGGVEPIELSQCDTLVFSFTPTKAGTFEEIIGFPNQLGSSIPVHNIELSGTTTSSGVTEATNVIPIKQNFPNPFTDETTILLPNSDIGSLELFDVIGNKMDVTWHQEQNGLVLERGTLPDGIYFYRIMQGDRGTVAKGSFVIGN